MTGRALTARGDRAAMFALAEPEPDYHDDPEAWQAWIDRRRVALDHVARARKQLERTRTSS